MSDLFGNPIVDETEQARPPRRAQSVLASFRYRPREHRDTCCATCRYHHVHQWAKRYHKCELVGFTRSRNTDVRARWVCDRWERDNREEEE